MRRAALPSLVLAILAVPLHAQPVAEMQSPNYRITATVIDTVGRDKSSSSYRLIDAAGQPTPIGYSAGNAYRMESGFLLAVGGVRTLDGVIEDVIGKVIELIAQGGLGKKGDKNADQAIKFLQDALDALARFEAGDVAALSNALNKVRQAIKNLQTLPVDTGAYQKLLTDAARQAVVVEINRIASIVGNGNPFVIDAVALLEAGGADLRAGDYLGAMQSFTQAYDTALLAL